MTAPTRTVVLGGTGYVGAELVDTLARTGEVDVRHHVLSVGRRAPLAHHPTAGALVETHRCDLSVPGTAARLVRGADVVVHLVAPNDPTRSWRTAGDGTAAQVLTEVVEAAEDGDCAPLVLLASTVSPLGEQDPAARSDHERSKRELETLLAAAPGQVRGATLRLGTVYGVGAGGAGRGVVVSMVRRAVRGEPLTVWRGAEVQRNLVHVRDVAAAFVHAAAHTGPAAAAQPWQVGGADQLSVHELAELVVEEVHALTGRRVPVEMVPPPAWAVPADFLDVRVDRGPFERATGWRPAASLRDGVRDIITHVQAAA